MSILKVENLEFSYRKNKVLKSLTFDLHPGINVLLGSNGSGKSTLIKILVTILKADKGDLSLFGISYENVLEIKNNIAYVPQVFDSYPNLRVREYLDFMKSFNKENNYESLIGQNFGIGDFSNKKLKELSEGMKKKVLIYGAFLMGSNFMVLDEPSSGLDKSSRGELREILSEITKENKDIIILFSTHLEEDIFSGVRKIIEISDGQISFDGGLEDFKERPI